MGEYEASVRAGRRRPVTRMRQIGVAVVVVVGASGLTGTPGALAAPAATFTVNTVDDVDDGTCDSAHCSLREAINAANATVAEDAVHFDISGPAPHVIQPTAGVFAYRPVIIDGTTQAGHAGTPVVQLDGSRVSSGDGVQFQGSGSTVRGLSITGFPGAGVWLRGDSHVIESSWIGVAVDGTADGGYQGVTVSGSGNRVGGAGGLGNVVADSVGVGIGVGGSNNVIEGNTVGLAPGGSAPASPNPFSNLNGIELNGSTEVVTGNVVRGNVVSGNRQEGIQVAGLNATGNTIADNLVGTDAAATVAVGNGTQFRGINLAFGANQTTIDGNVVAGHGIGIQLISPQTINNVVTANHVGTNANGDALPNGTGIAVYAGPNAVGGVVPGEGNVVHHNRSWGIQVGTAFGESAPQGVRIAGNSIDENGLSAIDLASVGANDAGDADGFENAGQNHPVLSSATGTASSTSVDGVLDSNADEAFRIEVFASPACDGSGKGEAARFLGAVAVGTDAAGHATFSATFAAAIGDGDVVTATATDASGNTSELSACVTASVDTSTALRVNTLTDDSDGVCDGAHCSLREAIVVANASPALDQIRFTVTGTIRPGAALPTITAPVDLDGGSAPACAGAPAVEIDGSSAGSNVNGLVVATGASGSSIRGLVVNRFGSGSGIQLLSDDNVVQCSYVGTNAAGTTAAPNRFGVDVQNGNRNLIGGTAAGEGNLLSGNSFQGARISGLAATGNRVKGNRIGTDVTGTVAVGNLAFGGVNLGGTANEVGGAEPGARNLISGNGHGIFLPNGSTNHVIEGNWIGVDVTGNAPLPNTSDGIAINGTPTPPATGNVIRGNVISGNGNSGVQLSGTNAVGNTIEDNLIGVGADGTTAVRNGHPSILTAGWGVLTTSGDATIRRNTIHNNGTGVQVGTSTSSVVAGVRITENSIAANARQSIDLGGEGPTANDAGDGDGGPNGLQNHPVITVATTTSVSGTLDAAASTGHRIEVFASGACGDAARFLAAVDVATDAGGHAAFSVTLSGVAAGEQLTATATTVAGSTSEVSPCAEATVATGRVRIVKRTEPAGGVGFTFTGPAGATTAADGELQGGEVIAFVQQDGTGSSMALLDLATGTVTPVPGTTAGRDPEWSSDGTRLAFVTGGTLKVLDVATQAVRSLPSATPSGTKLSPTWSPDGAWIAFHHLATDDIWVVPSDGLAPATRLTGATTYDSDPSWGPDGRIAFARYGAASDIYVGTFNPTTVTLDGITGLANTTDLTPVPRPMDWSPDGTTLVAGAAKVNAQDDLYLVPADGSGTPTQLTSGTTWDHGPTWSSDGTQIAYATDFGGTPKLRTIAANGAGGPQPTALGDAMAMDPSWGRSAVAGNDTYSLGDGDALGGLVDPGRAVTFTEQATDGWLLSGIDCGGHPRAVVEGSSVTVTPAAGDDIVCTFTNTEAPRTGTIIVEKQTLPDGDPTEFTFSGAVDGTLGDGDSVSMTVLAGEHVVSETMPASYWRPSSIRCDDDDSTGDTATASATFRVDVGETVRCVFTNQGYGRVRVAKVSDPAGATGFQFVETVGTNPPNPAASLDDGDTYGGYGPAGLVRSFTEQADSSWALASIDCGGHPNALVDLDARKVTFTPGVGDDILCTFTNIGLPSIAVAKTQRNDSVGGPLTADPLTGVQPGDQLTYAMQVSNTGPGTARSVTLTDPLPSRARIVGDLPTLCSVVAGEVVCAIGDLAPGQSATVAWTLHLSFGCDVAGSRGDDVITGGPSDERVCGFAGNDELGGGGGDDLLLGDTPVDLDLSDLRNTAAAGWTAPLGGGRQASNQVVASLERGADGNDVLRGDDGDDTAFGQGGDDTVLGHAGVDRLYGSAGADTVNGGEGGDELSGGPDDDSLTGDFGDDRLYGDDDNDTLVGGAGSDLLSGGDGDDVGFGGSGDDDAFGGRGRDYLAGGTENDVLFADSPGGPDEGDGLPDGLHGGPGFDTLFGQLGDNVTSEVVGNGTGRAGLWGEDDNDLLVGGPRADDAFGGAGNDEIRGGAGRDRLAGDLGDESGADPGGGGAADRIAGGDGPDLIYGQGGSDGHCTGSRCNVPSYYAGAPRNRGGAWTPTLFGGDGVDVIHGGDGHDRLDGGPEPRNVLVGAADVDFCSFGPGIGDTRDKSCEAPSKGAARVAAAAWSWAAFR